MKSLTLRKILTRLGVGLSNNMSNLNILDNILKENNSLSFKHRLSDYVAVPDCGGISPDELKNAPTLVRGWFYTAAFEGTIANCGIYKWLIELYNEDPELADFLDRIKAHHAAAYVRAAIGLFPNGEVPRDVGQRFDFCDIHEDKLNELDKQFTGAAEVALFSFRDYIADDRDEFQSQVETFWKIRRARRKKEK